MPDSNKISDLIDSREEVGADHSSRWPLAQGR